MGDVAALAGFDRRNEHSGQFRFAADHSADRHSTTDEFSKPERQPGSGQSQSSGIDSARRVPDCTVGDGETATRRAGRQPTADETDFSKRFPIGDECAGPTGTGIPGIPAPGAGTIGR